jgi:hypothetical protein
MGLLVACGNAGFDELAIDMGTDTIVADIDGDGRADVLALVHQFGNQPVRGLLSARRQTAAGRFAAAESLVVGCYPWSMTLADVDGDGRPDLVVTDVGAWNCSDSAAGDSVLLLRQDPAQAGRFLAAEKLAGELTGYGAAVADLNGDGAPDIAFGRGTRDAPRLTVLYQDPAQRGRFRSPVELAAPGSISQIVAGDIDRDGRADLFYVAYGPSTGYTPNSSLIAVTQSPDGTLGAPRALVTQTGVNVQRLAILDLDGDGRQDLIAHFTPYSTEYRGFVRALRQEPAPMTWSAPIDLSLDALLGQNGTAFGDVTGDGRPDVVMAGSWPESGGPYAPPDIRSRVNLLGGLGDGRFAHMLAQDVEPQPDAAAIGDLDGDGRNDVVLHDGHMAWWLRQSPSAPGSFEAPHALP